MNAKNPSHRRFAFVLFTFLALASAACGAAPDGDDGAGNPQASVTSSNPPSGEPADPRADTDAASPSLSWNIGEPGGPGSGASAPQGPSLGGGGGGGAAGGAGAASPGPRYRY